jgi:hypothetical protein
MSLRIISLPLHTEDKGGHCGLWWVVIVIRLRGLGMGIKPSKANLNLNLPTLIVLLLGPTRAIVQCGVCNLQEARRRSTMQHAI